MTTAKSLRASTQLPTSPNVGDAFLLTNDPQPVRFCLTQGVFTAFPATNTDILSESFHPGPSGTHYVGGFYDFAPSDDNFNPSINFGIANESHGGHVFLVAAAGAGGGDTTVRITGTSIDDSEVRTPGDTEDLVLDGSGPAGAYYETVNRWLGVAALEKVSGPDLLANFGFCLYYNRGGSDFFVTDINFGWLGAGNDSGFDIGLLHHTPNGWTYNPSAEPTPAPAIKSLQGTHGVDHNLVNNRSGGWRISGLAIVIAGSAGEGVLSEIITTANNVLGSGRATVVVSQ